MCIRDRYCKTYQGDEVELPTLYERLLEKANEKLHMEKAKLIEAAGYDQSDNIVLPIVEAISQKTLLTGKRHFEKSEIESMPIWNSLGLTARPLITQLIRENILHDYESDGKNYVYFSFDQMNDYFSAKTIFSMFGTEEEIRKGHSPDGHGDRQGAHGHQAEPGHRQRARVRCV